MVRARHPLPLGLAAITRILGLTTAGFLVIAVVLPWLPEPIGSRADVFRVGALNTLILTYIAGSVGLLLGALAAALYDSHPLSRTATRAYIWIFRGTPLLTQILFVYYALPSLFPWLRLDEMSAAATALALNVGAYHAEVIRAGLLAVPVGQIEAARCLGLDRWQRFTLVRLPQAAPVMIPPLMNNLVALLKDSAMASSIGLLELTLAGSRVSSETFRPAPVLLTIAAVYLAMTTLIGLIARYEWRAR